jgi:hypothetical protein
MLAKMAYRGQGVYGRLGSAPEVTERMHALCLGLEVQSKVSGEVILINRRIRPSAAPAR